MVRVFFVAYSIESIYIDKKNYTNVVGQAYSGHLIICRIFSNFKQVSAVDKLKKTCKSNQRISGTMLPEFSSTSKFFFVQTTYYDTSLLFFFATLYIHSSSSSFEND